MNPPSFGIRRYPNLPVKHTTDNPEATLLLPELNATLPVINVMPAPISILLAPKLTR